LCYLISLSVIITNFLLLKLIDLYQFENGLQNGQILISRLNVANSEICENGVTPKIPHGDFEKLAGMPNVHLFGAINFRMAPLIYLKWGHWPQLLFVLPRHCWSCCLTMKSFKPVTVKLICRFCRHASSFAKLCSSGHQQSTPDLPGLNYLSTSKQCQNYQS
jgi:hypothetical protein